MFSSCHLIHVILVGDTAKAYPISCAAFWTSLPRYYYSEFSQL